ncbi:MAG: type II toxin-antitoxin system Phd/YefM family antitoxin [Candidatus Binatia bacterium]
MNTIGAAKFKEQCLAILDQVGPEGIVITKRGKPVARLLPYEKNTSHGHLIGALRGQLFVDEEDDLLSTGAWTSDEWDEATAQS